MKSATEKRDALQVEGRKALKERALHGAVNE